MHLNKQSLNIPLGKVFTDGLDKSDRNESLLKRLKNIEDRSNINY